MGLYVNFACEVLHLFEPSLCFVELALKDCVGTVSVVLGVSCGRSLELLAVCRRSHCSFGHLESVNVLMDLDFHLVKVLFLCLNFLHLYLIVIQYILVECFERTLLFIKHIS